MILNRPLRANDVEVETVRRARCKIPDCGWKGGEHQLYPGANADRQGHLDWHRNGEPAQPEPAWPVPHPCVNFTNAISGHGFNQCYRDPDQAFRDAFVAPLRPFNNTRISVCYCDVAHEPDPEPDPAGLIIGYDYRTRNDLMAVLRARTVVEPVWRCDHSHPDEDTAVECATAERDRRAVL
jgi:hypothetical protein